MRFRVILAIGIFALTMSPVLAPAGQSGIANKTLGHYFFFGGLNVRVDKIETVAQADARPILKKAGGTPSGTGYILVTFSVQNPSSSDRRHDAFVNGGGDNIGFELADGSQIDERTADGIFLTPSLTDPPDALYPKQTIHIEYLIAGWDKTAITKMFLHDVGYNENGGAMYVRFLIHPTDVAVLPPQS